jgi:2-dehydropantoate 2-reductase
VAEVLRKAGFETELNDDVDTVVWEKLAFNAALNALAMVTRSTNGEMDNPFGRRIARQLVAEAVRVAQARGTRLDQAQITATVERALAEHPGHKASMLQDREARRATEIDFINGAVIREGERLGIPTPAHAIVYDLVKFAELKDQTSA